MTIKICNNCKGFDYNKVISKINDNFSNIEYQIGCNNMCGIGRSKVVIILNNKPIIADNIDDLISKMKKENI
ncbi:MAG TPA: hypothetical protein PLV83_04965 [Bacilli bacterium]|nr:hypothetical protein [Bacilli bacterium]